MSTINAEKDPRRNRLKISIIAVTTIAAISGSHYYPFSGSFVVFQNLFYIPIILSCMYYTKRGFIYSICLTVLYIVLFLVSTSERNVVMQVFAKAVLFITTAGIVTFLSIRRKRAEEELRENAETFRRLFEDSTDPVLLLDREGFVDCNTASVAILGYTSKDEVIKKHPGDLSPQFQPGGRPSSEKAAEMMDMAIRNGHHLFEWIHLKSDGTELPIEVMLTPIVIRGTQLLHVVWRDITDCKRSEEALRASQLQLTEAMDLAHIVYWESDPLAEIYTFNDHFYALYGTTAEHEGGYHMTREEYAKRFMHPDDLAFYNQFVEESTLRPRADIADVERRIIRRDGEVRHILTRARIVKDDSGRIIKRYGANQDITDRKQAEAALQESEERLKFVLEGSQLGFWDWNIETGEVRRNMRWAEMLGYTVEELETDAAQWTDLIHPDDRAAAWQSIRDHLDGRTPAHAIEYRMRTKDGQYRWILDRARIVQRKPDGQPLRMSGTHLDVTDRKLAEEEKAHLESQLLQSRKMEAIGTLAGGVAHDFNNILTAIIGFASVLQMDMDKDDPGVAYIGQILASAHKAANLTQSLLVFSRKQQIDLKPHRMNDIVEQTTKLLKRLLTEDIDLKVTLTPVNPTIMADVTQIDQILINLATNARDAMPKGGTLRIETRTLIMDDEFIRARGYGERGEFAVLSVADTGVGMDEKIKEHIFEPFFTTKEVGKGTGLGLSTVYGAVKQHNGYVTVDSEPNKGTTFRIWFSLVHSIEEEAVLKPQDAKKGIETILVAEDDPAVRMLIVDILRRYGYTAIEAVDGDEALHLFMANRDKVSLVICDVVMPKMNGKEVCEEIKRSLPNTKVLYTSGYTREVMIDKGVEDATVDFITKPINPRKFLTKVREVLDR